MKSTAVSSATAADPSALTPILPLHAGACLHGLAMAPSHAPMSQVNGQYVGSFAAYTKRLGFAPWGGRSGAVTEEELDTLARTAGTSQFTPEKLLPAPLVGEMVRKTIKASEARAAG